MYPTLLSLGSVSLSSYGVCFFLAFIFFAFSIWKHLRDAGVSDEKIFDNIIVVSTSALIGARIFFVLTHFATFSKNILSVFLLWSYPGLSFWGALVLGLIIFVFYAQKQKLPVGLLADGYARAFPLGMIFVSLGVLLDGSTVGRLTTWFTALPDVGEVGVRHPIGLYGAILATLCLLFMSIIDWQIPKKTIPKGYVALVILSFIGFSQIILAFFRDDLLYWQSLPVEYLFSGIVFIIPLGVLLIKIEIVRKIRVLFTSIKKTIVKGA